MSLILLIIKFLKQLIKWLRSVSNFLIYVIELPLSNIELSANNLLQARKINLFRNFINIWLNCSVPMMMATPWLMMVDPNCSLQFIIFSLPSITELPLASNERASSVQVCESLNAYLNSWKDPILRLSKLLSQLRN
jgi:hypothetical protein